MVTWSEEDQTVTFESLRARMKPKFDRGFCRNIICYYLNCLLITPKKTHLTAFGMNEQGAKEKRRHYTLKMFELNRRELNTFVGPTG